MYDRYNEGDLVKIIHGPFEGIEGTITNIDRVNGLCTVSLIFFGSETPTEVEFASIEKVN